MSGFCSLQISFKTTLWILPFLHITVKIQSYMSVQLKVHNVKLVDSSDGSKHHGH